MRPIWQSDTADDPSAPTNVAPAGGDSPPDGLPAEIRVDTWERWWRVFNWVFVGFLVLAVALSLADPSVSVARRLVSLPILAVPVAGYIRLTRTCLFTSRSMATYRWVALYLTVAIVSFFVLTALAGGYWFLAFILFFQFWMLLPIWTALTLTATMSLAMWVMGSLRSGNGLRLEPGAWLIFLGSVVVSGVLGAFIDAIIRQSRQRLELARQLEAERHARTDAERRAGALEERGRLARDLHDTLAQGFTSIVLHLEAADAVLPMGADGREHLDQARRMARESLGEVRRLVWSLRPAELHETDLPDALRRMVADWGRRHGLPATFRLDGNSRSLPPDIEVSLLRIAQEALTNSEKHADAARVDVVLTMFDDAVNLDVRDDGRGFAPNATVTNDGSGHGFGLIGIRDRVRALGGTVEIEGRPGEGTIVAVSIPFAEPTVPVEMPAIGLAGGRDGGPAGRALGRLHDAITARRGA